jgi:manganese-dependent inorganic pyrophosphatase
VINNAIQKEESIYIVGHRKPDLDSVASAYAYEQYKCLKGEKQYKGVVCDDINPLTKWVFSFFQKDIPQHIDSIENKKVILVDHTAPEQRPLGWQSAQILEVVDHHRLDLNYISPQNVIIKTYGSTATIIAELFIKEEMKISKGLAGIMLSAILDDTLALKSPITTTTDKLIVEKLAKISEIGDLTSFVKKLFNKKDTWNSMPASKIVESDMKESHINGVDIVVSQVETMDNSELEKREDELLSYMHNLENKQESDLRILMLTDLLKNNCILLAVGKRVLDLEEIFRIKLIQNQKIYLPGVLSRKKQVLTPILDYYSKK